MSLSVAAEGITLRAWREDDLEPLVAEANSRAVWRNLIHTFPHPYTERDATAWIDRCREQSPARDLVVACNDRLVGVCGVTMGVGVSAYPASIGYWLGEAHWGQGIMSAALAAFIPYAMDTFEVVRFQAEVFAWNPSSARVLERNGFVREGTRRKAIYKDGEFVDESFFSLLPGEVGRG